MDQTENRYWPAVFAIVMIGFSFWWLNKCWKTDAPVNPEDISYEMPRPKNLGPEYDISGRRIVHNLTEVQRQAQAAAAVAKGGVVPKTPPQDIKAKQAAADAKKKEAAKKAAQNANRKAQMGVRIVGRGEDGRLSAIPMLDSKGNSPAQGGYQSYNTNEIANPSPGQDEPKRTASQWRAVLFAAPTAVNGMEFYKAYRTGEIVAHDFYEITDELLSDSGPDRQQRALSLLGMDVSVNSFTILVSHAARAPELKLRIDNILKTYGELPRFPILSRLLFSGNSAVVAKATELLNATVAAQQLIIQGRQSPGAAAIPAKNFQTFVLSLQRLIKAGGTSKPTFEALLASINALMTAAGTA